MLNLSAHAEQKENGQDSFCTITTNEALLFCIADGAGGVSGGKEASQFLSSPQNIALIDNLNTPEEIEEHIRNLDIQLSEIQSAGESTIIIGKISKGWVYGASVGDSECWIFNNDFDYELTSMQLNKPLMGSGLATPIGFGPVEIEHSLLVGTDGLFKYTQISAIRKLVLSREIQAKNYCKLAMLDNGSYPDDVAAIVVSSEL